MSPSFHKSTQRLALAIIVAAPVLASAACAAPDASTEELGSNQSDLMIRINPGGGATLPPLKIGPGLAPPVTLPAYWDTGARTATSIGMGWYEPGGNPQTLVYRQRYDLDGNAVGGETLIKTFNGLPAGNADFTDSAATSDDQTGPDTDRMSCYRVVEKSGECGPSPAGATCVSTPLACAFTRGATPHSVGRVQLRIKASTVATAAAPGDHMQVRLQSPYYPYARTPSPRNNNTWLDSTQVDFVAGSNFAYDLRLANISDIADITQITVATPDGDGFCINELELLVDDTRAFFKSFGSNGVDCQWAYKSDQAGGSQVSIGFAELRRSADWQGYNPPNLGIGNQYASFVGYRGPEMIQYLDSVFGDALRNPANGHGDGAGFRDTHWTTTLAADRRHLHVAQHVVAQDFGWQGSVAADPTFDLVIHNDATCGFKHWCIAVENVDANSSFSGWSSLIPLIGAGIQAEVNSEANGEMQKAMTSMGANALNDPPAGFEYCFVTGHGVETPFSSQGFGAGSLTLCFQND